MIILNDNFTVKKLTTVNSRYWGHPWDRSLVSVIARVHNNGVGEKIHHYWRNCIYSHCTLSPEPTAVQFFPQREHQNFI